MRWIPLAILIYALVLVQTSLAGLLTFERLPAVGRVSPDLLAILAVCLALDVHNGIDAMMGAWLMGLAVDLTTGAGPEVSTVVGPMALGYALAAGATFRLRELVFRENAITQCILAVIFCLLAHGFWVTAQWLLALRAVPWSGYLMMLVQAALLAVYTGVLMPLGRLGFRWTRRWVLAPSADRSRRRRR